MTPEQRQHILDFDEWICTAVNQNVVTKDLSQDEEHLLLLMKTVTEVILERTRP